MSELYLIVRIAERRIAFRASEVHSVIELEGITPIPMAPSYVAGLAAMRSKVLTVIDCRRSLGLEDVEAGAQSKTAVVIENEGFLYALAVDKHEDVIQADLDPVVGSVNYGERWSGVALGIVEAESGAALLVDASGFIHGPEAMKAA